ncbi:hypothetical protein R6Q59_007611 [Mikania micrantha]
MVVPVHTSIQFSVNRQSRTMKTIKSFAAALIGNQLDCWVMNVVIVSDLNTLPVIYDR